MKLFGSVFQCVLVKAFETISFKTVMKFMIEKYKNQLFFM